MNINIIFKEKNLLYIQISLILISILSMSSYMYSHIGILYKLATILGFLFVIYFTINKNILDKRYFIITLVFIFSNLISSLVARENIISNIIEIIFMIVYLQIFNLGSKKTLLRLFKYSIYIVQSFSFFMFIIAIIIIFFKINIKIGFDYYYGIFNGRFWGIINPNASAIFSIISMFTGLFLISKGNKYSLYLKYNLVFQLVLFSLQQSRGAILSLIFIIILYFVFLNNNTLKKKILLIFLTVVSLLSFIFVLNFSISSYEYSTEYKNSDSIEESLEIESRLSSYESSGRKNIWVKSFDMLSEKPLLGHGNRNIPEKYHNYYSDYVIKNSLKGGGFHNIYLTILISTGIIGLCSFLILLFYICKKFIVYLIVNKEKDNKFIIILIFGILLGQFFESTIMYSTNFINIYFWLLVSLGLFFSNNTFKYEEITDPTELQKIELEILDYVVSVCEKLDLKYFLAYGTLIGAVRHKGFIPWDDDVDIIMFRDDYEKLQDYLIRSQNYKYKVMSYKNNRRYVYPFMKVIDKDTYLVEDDVRIDSKMGVYIDIFPIDGDYGDNKFRDNMTQLIKKRQLSCYTFSGIKNTNSLLNTLIRYLFVCLFYFTDNSKYVKSIDNLAKSQKIHNSEFCDFLIYKDKRKPILRKSWFDETIKLKFCEKEYSCPKFYDKILKVEYGNYMELPKPENRVSNHKFKVWRKISN